METNALPRYDMSDNPTQCCPRFDPEGWDDQELEFSDKLFVKATTRSLFHIPINMGSVFPRILSAITRADAMSEQDFIVLSRDCSPWTAEHFFAVTRDVPGQEMVRLSGHYLTRVFEGPYRKAPEWDKEMQKVADSRGQELMHTYFFYTTCPRCAKFYGKHYIVAVAQLQ